MQLQASKAAAVWDEAPLQIAKNASAMKAERNIIVPPKKSLARLYNVARGVSWVLLPLIASARAHPLIARAMRAAGAIGDTSGRYSLKVVKAAAPSRRVTTRRSVLAPAARVFPPRKSRLRPFALTFPTSPRRSHLPAAGQRRRAGPSLGWRGANRSIRRTARAEKTDAHDGGASVPHVPGKGARRMSRARRRNHPAAPSIGARSSSASAM
jgi:hypothetical protein